MKERDRGKKIEGQRETKEEGKAEIDSSEEQTERVRKEEKGDQLVSAGEGGIGSGWSLSLKWTEYPGQLLCDLESLHFKMFSSWLVHISGMQEEMRVRKHKPQSICSLHLNRKCLLCLVNTNCYKENWIQNFGFI